MKNNKFEAFRSFHDKKDPLILYNVWDVTTAKAISDLGARAIATSSLAIARSHGFEDGEKMPLGLLLSIVEKIVQSVDIPVTVDFECGYAKTILELQDNIKTLLDIGVVGINIEDQKIGTNELHSIEEQCQKLHAIREVSKEVFINARTDIFFKNLNHNEELVMQAIERGLKYKEAGADCLFVPKLKDLNLIKNICQSLDIPVNIVMLTTNLEPINKEIIDAGVSRISYGPSSYNIFLENFQEQFKIFSSIK